MTEEEFIEKYDSGEPFTASELKDILTTLPNVAYVAVMQDVFRAEGRFFILPYQQEFMSDTSLDYVEQPYEVNQVVKQKYETIFEKKGE